MFSDDDKAYAEQITEVAIYTISIIIFVLFIIFGVLN